MNLLNLSGSDCCGTHSLQGETSRCALVLKVTAAEAATVAPEATWTDRLEDSQGQPRAVEGLQADSSTTGLLSPQAAGATGLLGV